MRKNTNLVFAIACTLLVFVSCQKEFSVENGTILAGAGGGGTTTSSADCKACSYLPYCVGSKYAYSDTSALGTATIRNGDILSTSDTVAGSTTYSKVVTSTGTSYITCTNGETKQTVFNITTTGPNGPITIPQIVTTALKANQPVGTTWIDTNANGLSQIIIYKYSILEKGINRTVAGKTYPDVIHVHQVTSVIVPVIGNFDTNINEYYMAKSVGLIDYIVKDATTGSLYLHSVLTSYYIP